MLEISMNNLQFACENEPGKLILGGINYQAKTRDFVCFLGESGYAKSTLLRLLLALKNLILRN